MATQAQLRANPSLVRSRADVAQLTPQQQAQFSAWVNAQNAANPRPAAPPNPQFAPLAKPASAFATVTSYLNQWGLGSLAGWVWDRYRALGGGTNAMNQIQLEMPNQPAFKARFPAYQQLQQEGRAMTVSEMLSYEKQAAGIMQEAGLPSGFYDQPADIAKFMAGQVSLNELQQRVDLARQAAMAPHPVKDALQNMYGLSSGDLTAYFLDPNKALPVLSQKFQAGQIGGAAAQTGFGNVTSAQAEQLAAQGVSQAAAQQGFSQLAALSPLMRATASDQSAIGTPTQIAAQFEGNAQAEQQIQSRKDRRLAAFNAASGFNPTNQGVSGLGSTQ